ncbi:MAG: prenyltransferase/squalene oxidase repeat-containing protein [Acidimicrobiia bacterium]
MWLSSLRHDAVSALLSSADPAVALFAARDLVGEAEFPIENVWRLVTPQQILRRQRDDGSWAGPRRKTAVYPENHTDLVTTFKQLRLLVERYEFTSAVPEMARAAEYLLGFQTDEGDIRGFIANQYATYYTGYVLSLLIRASCSEDARVDEGVRWLLSMRQEDGGWSVPILTHHFDRETMYRLTSEYHHPVQPDRARPFSHNCTDMVLRAFAVHPGYRSSREARKAGELLKSRFFRQDAYSFHKAARYWTRFIHWWPSLLTSLESLSLLGFGVDDPDMRGGLDWLIEHQGEDGLWYLSGEDTGRPSSPRVENERAWLTLRICRILKRFLGEG